MFDETGRAMAPANACRDGRVSGRESDFSVFVFLRPGLNAGGTLDTPGFIDKVARLFRARRGCRDGCRMAARINLYETPVSAIEDSPQTSARFSEPELDEERPRHSQEPSPGWTQAPHTCRHVMHGRAVAAARIPARATHHSRTGFPAGPRRRPAPGSGLSSSQLGRCFRRRNTPGRDYQPEDWQGGGAHAGPPVVARGFPRQPAPRANRLRPGVGGSIFDCSQESGRRGIGLPGSVATGQPAETRMNWPQTVSLALLRAYKLVVSPVLHTLAGPFGGCRFHPTCSQYAADAVRQHGVMKGIALGAQRVCRCHPWGGSGYDPVPEPAGRSLRERKVQ
jgi:putative membrane protein insertion efficiency factor